MKKRKTNNAPTIDEFNSWTLLEKEDWLPWPLDEDFLPYASYFIRSVEKPSVIIACRYDADGVLLEAKGMTLQEYEAQVTLFHSIKLQLIYPEDLHECLKRLWNDDNFTKNSYLSLVETLACFISQAGIISLSGELLGMFPQLLQMDDLKQQLEQNHQKRLLQEGQEESQIF